MSWEYKLAPQNSFFFLNLPNVNIQWLGVNCVWSYIQDSDVQPIWVFISADLHQQLDVPPGSALLTLLGSRNQRRDDYLLSTLGHNSHPRWTLPIDAIRTLSFSQGLTRRTGSCFSSGHLGRVLPLLLGWLWHPCPRRRHLALSSSCPSGAGCLSRFKCRGLLLTPNPSVLFL